MAGENEVVTAVKKSIDELGAVSKQNYEELRKAHEDLKGIVESQGTTDPISKEQLTKLANDVTVRQDEMDKASAAMKKRVDDFETMLQRTPGSSGESKEATAALVKAARQFHIDRNAGGEGVKHRTMRKYVPNMEEFKAYCDIFGDYLRYDEKGLEATELKALQAGIDADGGYTITPEVSSKIISRIFESDPIRQLASVMSISTGALEMLEDLDEAEATWEGERVATDETGTPQLNMKRIPVHIMSARPRATQVLLDDSGINVESWLSNKVATKFARKEGASFVTGTGVGQPTGFGTYDAWDTAGTFEFGKVEQQNMGHASQFTTDGLLKVKFRLLEEYLMRSTWLTNRLNVLDIMLLKDGDGQYIWRPGLTEGTPSILLGLPLRMSTTVATTASSALAIYLADWKEFYMIVDRQGISVQRDPYTAKPFVEFYTRKRVGGDVVNFQAGKIGKVAA
jgi:HK97 family phage major capsid protein